MANKKGKEKFRKWVHVYRMEIISVTVLILGVIVLSFFTLPDHIEKYMLDIRFKWRGDQEQSKDIVVIEIAKDTLDKLKSRFPIPRRYYGILINALKSFDPKMIALDIVFAEPSISMIDFPTFQKYLEKSGKKIEKEKLLEIYNKYSREGLLSRLDDETFRRSMKSADNVFLPYHFIFKKVMTDQSSLFVANEKENIYPPFQDVIKGSGFINVDFREGKVRKIPLFIKYEGKEYRHIILNMALYALGIDSSDVHKKKGVVNLKNKVSIPVDRNYQMTVNWAGRWEDTFKHYSFVDIINSYGQMLKGEKPLIDLNTFRDKICIVGLTETGIADAKSVPMQDVFPGVGVWLHALDTILMDRYLIEYPHTMTLLYSIALMLIAILLVKKFQPHTSIPAILLMISVYTGVAFVLFGKVGLILNITRPTLMIIFGVVVTLSYNYLKLKDLMDLQLTFEQKLVMTAKTGVPIDKQKIGKYQVLGEIGRGGMAIVFKAREKDSGRVVAIKVINPQFSADPTFKIRFKREAKVMMRIKHPNIIAIYELNKQMGVYYYAMEYFVGCDLSDRFPVLRKKGEQAMLDIVRQVLDGLRSCHEKNIVHRDIKPANILINEEDVIKITDFGLARPIEDDYLMTTIGQAVGTPAYCAPEQIMGKKVTEKSDIYSLGVLAYEMFVGSLPYQAATIADLARQKVYGKIKPVPDNLGISEEFKPILLKMLAAKPTERYQSAKDVLDDIEAMKKKKESISEMHTQAWDADSREQKTEDS